MSVPEALLLRLADEELFVGHVLTARAGWGPELELNLAMSSMGQDEIGHARLLYGAIVGDDAAAINALVYDRPAADFHVSALATVDSQDWATLVVKHWLYELADAARLGLLAGLDGPCAGLAERMAAEEVYHREFWSAWFTRTLAGAEGGQRMQQALDVLWPGAAELFALPEVAPDALRAAEARWRGTVTGTCAEHGLELRGGPPVANSAAELLAQMRSVYASAPGQW